jgi:hypothetical protein
MTESLTHSESMNQRFRNKLNHLRDSEPALANADSTSSCKNFPTSGHIRYLAFVWPNGREKLCNYAYLVSTDYNPEESCILLHFTSETIEIIGSNLDKLHYDLRYQLPEEIIAVNERYISTMNETDCIVTKIAIVKPILL